MIGRCSNMGGLSVPSSAVGVEEVVFPGAVIGFLAGHTELVWPNGLFQVPSRRPGWGVSGKYLNPIMGEAPDVEGAVFL